MKQSADPLSKIAADRPETSLRKPTIAALSMLVALFAGGGYWLHASQLSGAVVAQGVVAVEGKPKTIQHLDGGIVAKISVVDGQKVDKGDLLLRLDDTTLRANLAIYGSRLNEAVARRARLMAERDNRQQLILDVAVLDALGITPDPLVTAGQESLFLARRSTRLGQIAQMREKITQVNNQIDGVVALKASKQAQHKLVTSDFDAARSLKGKGFATSSQVGAFERQVEDLSGQIAEHTSEIARLKNTITETEVQILQIDREFRQAVLTELREVDREIIDNSQQLLATKSQFARIDIRAPVSGLVHELAFTTIGGVVPPGGAILQIIPSDDDLIVSANIEPQFIDEIHPGQVATIRFSAFNQRTTPQIDGTVKLISPDAVTDQNTGMRFYRVLVQIPAEQLKLLKGEVLIPGMPAEVFIKTRDRTALNYLVKPLSDQISRAFREE